METPCAIFSYDIINEYDRRVHTIRHAPTITSTPLSSILNNNAGETMRNFPLSETSASTTRTKGGFLLSAELHLEKERVLGAGRAWARSVLIIGRQ